MRRALCDWMGSMHMESAGASATLDRYIGYCKPYATSHEELDRDVAVQEEVRNVARALCEAVEARRAGRMIQPGEHLTEPRPK